MNWYWVGSVRCGGSEPGKRVVAVVQKSHGGLRKGGRRSARPVRQQSRERLLPISDHRRLGLGVGHQYRMNEEARRSSGTRRRLLLLLLLLRPLHEAHHVRQEQRIAERVADVVVAVRLRQQDEDPEAARHFVVSAHDGALRDHGLKHALRAVLVNCARVAPDERELTPFLASILDNTAVSLLRLQHPHGTN